jgi:arylsulfatase A-like enzyme
MNRRDFLKTFGGAAALMLGRRADLIASAGDGPAGRKPNIIYILADDLGYGDLGCYGQQKIKTPNIDALAADGMRFTQHYAGSAVCAPSRCCLMTGLHTGHAYVRGNRGVQPEGQLPIPADTQTVAELLKKAGYATACIGKWGLGGPGTEGEPNRQGFDHWFGYLCQTQAHSYYPDHLWRNGERIALDGKTYSHDLFTKDALEFIRRSKDRPFFLYLPYTIPHAKLEVPELGEYAKAPWTDAQKKQAAMISRMDRDVGRIAALLKETGIDKDTLVMFSSDNGAHGDAGTLEHFSASGPLRGRKRDLYEGGIRVPMIARWTGRIAPGTATDHVSAFWDVLPTLAEIAGVEAPGGIDGISFLPTLLRQGEQKKHSCLYWEFYERGGKQAVRMGDWKGVRLNVNNNAGAPIELYDLAKDLAEKKNVAAEHPQVVARIEKIMASAHRPSQLFQFGPAKGAQKAKKP